jgi:murein DD-endopeptidase MepM/ murein hydrolase activator NlpD
MTVQLSSLSSTVLPPDHFSWEREKRMELSTKVWPLPLKFSTVTSTFGPRTITLPSGEVRKQARHGGLDIAAPVGTPVLSIDSGLIYKTVLDHPVAGHYVEVKHPNGNYSRYLHLSDIQVKVGDQLRTGSKIGLSGGGVGIRGAGTTTGPHLHLEVWQGGAPYQGGQPIDPQPYLASLFVTKVAGRLEENKGLIVAAAGGALLAIALTAGSRSRRKRRNPLRRLTVVR